MKHLLILAGIAFSFGFVGCAHDHHHATTTTTTSTERTVTAAPTGASTTVVRSAY